MNYALWTRAHQRSLLFLIAVLVAAGGFGMLRLPSSLFPAVDFPRVVVSMDAGDQPAEQMEVSVTRPVEQAIRRVPGVQGVRSVTSRGSAEVSVNFAWGVDMASATLQVNAATSQIVAQLPAGTVLSTRRMDPTVFPTIAYSFTSDSVSQVRLREIADYQIAPLLSGVAGVSRAEAIGGAIQEFQVLVDPVRLQSYGLTTDAVSAAISASNVIKAVGRIEDHYKLLLVITDAALKDTKDIGRVALARGANGLVRISDVATVVPSTVPRITRVTADGRQAVLLQIYQQPGSDTVQIAKDVKALLATLQSQLPPGVTVANWYDQSDLIVASAASVRDAILIGIVLAALVLLVFLRNVKVTVIAVAVVPTVLAITVLVLGALNLTFNVMTLGGMAAAVGLIIDDAIVMTEHIVRRLRDRHDGASGRPTTRDARSTGTDEGDQRDQRGRHDPADRHDAGLGPTGRTVVRAAREFLRPLAGSSAATLVIFAPLAFLSGVTGAFFKALSITMGTGLFVSFLVTAIGVPILASAFLDEKDARQEEGGRLADWMKQRYAAVMAWLLPRPWWVLAAVIPLAALGAFAFTQVGSGFMPAIDEGGFVLDYRSQPGTALSETDRMLRQVEAIVLATRDVDTFSRRTGTGLGGSLSEANSGDFFIRLKATNRRPVDQVMEDIRGRVEHDVPGLSVEMAQLMEDLIGDLTAVPQPIEVKLYANDPAQLQGAAIQVADLLARVDGVTGVRNGINPAGDALDIHVDRTLADLEGVDAGMVAKAANDAMAGSLATQVLSGVKTVGVRVWTPPDQRRSASDLGKVMLRAPDGHLFPLSRVATMQVLSGQAQIAREDLKRMIAVTGRLAGRDLGSVMVDVRAALSAPGALPAGVSVAYGGLYEQQQIAFSGLMVVFAAAAALVYLLLLFMYESFAVATSIVLCSLLSVSAVFVGLWITHIELNITAMMGMTMIIGIVTEVGIFFFSEREELIGAHSGREALVMAGQNRMRPIAMTTIAAILTLLPLALAIGQGSEMQQPLAVAIISGLSVQLPLVLLAMPAFLSIMSPSSTRGDASKDG